MKHLLDNSAKEIDSVISVTQEPSLGLYVSTSAFTSPQDYKSKNMYVFMVELPNLDVVPPGRFAPFVPVGPNLESLAISQIFSHQIKKVTLYEKGSAGMSTVCGKELCKYSEYRDSSSDGSGCEPLQMLMTWSNEKCLAVAAP